MRQVTDTSVSIYLLHRNSLYLPRKASLTIRLLLCPLIRVHGQQVFCAPSSPWGVSCRRLLKYSVPRNFFTFFRFHVWDFVKWVFEFLLAIFYGLRRIRRDCLDPFEKPEYEAVDIFVNEVLCVGKERLTHVSSTGTTRPASQGKRVAVVTHVGVMRELCKQIDADSPCGSILNKQVIFYRMKGGDYFFF
ncbi:hypothetical protein K1719_026039 [Acacia pycnantha]|nr:hypothetical protein K1719_026039 [Acacia pycnantha]